MKIRGSTAFMYFNYRMGCYQRCSRELCMSEQHITYFKEANLHYRNKIIPHFLTNQNNQPSTNR